MEYINKKSEQFACFHNLITESKSISIDISCSEPFYFITAIEMLLSRNNYICISKLTVLINKNVLTFLEYKEFVIIDYIKYDGTKSIIFNKNIDNAERPHSKIEF